MFPITSDGVLEEPSIFFEQEKFLEDLFVDFVTSAGNANDQTENIVKKKRPRNVSTSNEAQEISHGGSEESKKSAHRFTEKQRRQEMSALYASLRSLLPLEYIKGKRAISDHMEQAVSYINDTKKKIEEMKVKRNSLRKRRSLATAAVEAQINHNNSNNVHNFVEINLFKDGLFEILITSSNKSLHFPLSMVLAYLVGRELNIINCISTKGSDRCYLHKIQIEINDFTSIESIDLSKLQEELMNVLKFV